MITKRRKRKFQHYFFFKKWASYRLYSKRPPPIVNRTVPKIIAISVHTVNRFPLSHRWEFCHLPQLDLFTRECAPLVLYIGIPILSILKPIHLMVCWICTIMELPPYSKHKVFSSYVIGGHSVTRRCAQLVP